MCKLLRVGLRRLQILLVVSLVVHQAASAVTYYSLATANEQLGHGFDTQVSLPLEACLDGDWRFQGGSNANLSYDGLFDANTLISDLSGSVKGGINLVIFGGSVKYSMRKKVTTNTNAVSSVMRFGYQKGHYSLENRQPKADILALLKTNPNAVRQRCGDAFIHNITLGSNLYVAAKIHFRSKEQYEWYQTKVKVKIGFWSKTKTKTKEQEQTTTDAVYSIRVASDAPLPPALADLIATGTSYCRTDALDPCYTYVERLFAYLFEGGTYPADLTNDYLSVISYDVEPYSRSGHYQLANAGIGTLSVRYQQLSNRLRAYQDLVDDRLESLTAFRAVSVTPEEMSALDLELTEQNQHKQRLAAAADICARLPGVTPCEQHIEAAIRVIP